MLKTLMASVLILGIVFPVTAQEGPGRGRTDYNPDMAQGRQQLARVCTRDQSGGRLSLRTGPGREYGKVKEIPNGQAVRLIDGQYGPDGYYWWRVSHNGRQGWVRADYVCDDPQ
ncbi:SH3 domain-containing protein [Floridanema aerugineum]|jgi:hypothetical protein|uniref:SH3 domain-containing protein n=1 Tax=Floridaenema aerugineum BLCC-F46 TaxID=3153654 RepID=A0ABV4XIX1_9CYAN